MRKLLITGCLAVLGLLVAPITQAGPAETALAATADVLFELDIENASYKARHDGYVDILFGPQLPEERYRDAITRLKAHPDIPGVLAGRGASDFCPLP